MKTLIIAEVSSNHMGDIKVAEAMVDACAQAGVDIVKFQSWQADKLRRDFPDYESVYARHRKTELSDESHRHLVNYCNDKGVEFLTTCFDIDRVDFLASLGLKRIKVPSPDLSSHALIARLAERFQHVIVSTGMATDESVTATIEKFRGANITYLHCVSVYPTPPEQCNISRMLWLKSMTPSIGFSDHSQGADAAKLAIALGAQFVEKHFTLSRWLPGKDQAMSSELNDFAEIVRWARLVPVITGSPHPGLSAEEMRLRGIYVGKWGNNA